MGPLQWGSKVHASGTILRFIELAKWVEGSPVNQLAEGVPSGPQSRDLSQTSKERTRVELQNWLDSIGRAMEEW